MKRLIVTADDIGLDRGMTAGAIEAHRNGIVTACSVVANGREFDDAVARLREVPSLEVGIHLTLVEERALTTGRPMPRNWMRFLLSRRGNFESELRAQIEKVLGTGLRVTHFNSHQHLHMLPKIWRVVERLARKYAIGYVSVVNDRGGRGSLARRGIFAALARRRLAGRTAGRRAGGGPATEAGGAPYTIGVTDAGHLTAQRLIELMSYVEGLTELVTHPGIGVSGYRHWGYEWEEETRALCDLRVREAIAKHGIELIPPSRSS